MPRSIAIPRMTVVYLPMTTSLSHLKSTSTKMRPRITSMLILTSRSCSRKLCRLESNQSSEMCLLQNYRLSALLANPYAFSLEPTLPCLIRQP
jgi:hypothetical protein